MKLRNQPLTPGHDTRIAALERQVRWLKGYAAAATAFALALPLLASRHAPVADVLRSKGIIIEDEQGRERILIGAPDPARGQPRAHRPGAGQAGLGPPLPGHGVVREARPRQPTAS